MEKKSRKQLIVKISCVIAAFVLWLYTSNKDNTIKTYRIEDIPVQLINEDTLTQSRLVVSPGQKYSISLKINGVPSEIYSVKSEQFRIVADLSGYVVKKGENRIPVDIVQRPPNINIVNDGAMWVKVNIDDFVEKTFPIKVVDSGNIKSGYHKFAPDLKPTNVVISGSAQYVNSVQKVVADLNINGAEKDLNLLVPLKALDSGNRFVKEISIEPDVVDIIMPIRKTKEVGINIKTKGELKKDYILKSIIPIKSTVTIAGNADYIQRINKIDTEPIDFSKLKENERIKLKLIIPENVSLINSSHIIEAEVKLDKVIQKNMNLNISIRNLKPGYDAELEKDNLSLVVSGGKTAISNLYENSINCFVNLEDLGEGEYVIPVNINLPFGIDKISQNIEYVKVVITKKSEVADSSNSNVETGNSEEVFNNNTDSVEENKDNPSNSLTDENNETEGDIITQDNTKYE